MVTAHCGDSPVIESPLNPSKFTSESDPSTVLSPLAPRLFLSLIVHAMSWRRKGLLRHAHSTGGTGEERADDPMNVRYEENAEETDWNSRARAIHAPLARSTSDYLQPSAPPPTLPFMYWPPPRAEETVIKREEGTSSAPYNPRKRLMQHQGEKPVRAPGVMTEEDEQVARAAAAAVLASRMQSEVLVFPAPVANPGLFRYASPFQETAARMAGATLTMGSPGERREGEFMVPRERVERQTSAAGSSGGETVPVRSASWSVRQDLAGYMADVAAAARDRSKTHPQIVKRPRTTVGGGIQESVIQSTAQGRSLLPDYLRQADSLTAPGSPASTLSSASRRPPSYRPDADAEMDMEPGFTGFEQPSSEMLSRMSSTTSSSSFPSPRPLHYTQSAQRYPRPPPAVEMDEEDRESVSPVLSDVGSPNPIHTRMDSIKVEAGTRRPSSCPSGAASPHSPSVLRTSGSVYEAHSPSGLERPRSRLLESTASGSRGAPYWSTSSTSSRPTAGGSGEEVWETSVSVSPAPSGSGGPGRTSSETEPFVSIDNSYNEDDDGSMPLHIDMQAQDGSGICLKIVRQPESHYRPRYQKEGSRGCVKDSTGRFPLSVQLTNWEGEHSGGKAVLQVFIGSESDPVRVHPWYRVCIVGGRTSSAARVVNIDASTTALELDVPPGCKGLVNVNCLGIVKLRNSDLEHSGTSAKKDALNRRKWTADVRLVFRAVMTDSDAQTHTVQAVSSVISCTPSSGVPQIQYTSLNQAPVSGGTEVVVIGRNLVKGSTRLFIQEVAEVAGREKVLWQETVSLLPNFFTQVHLVAKMPPYRLPTIHQPVPVSLILKNNKKSSQAFPFLYVPAPVTGPPHGHAPSSPSKPSTSAPGKPSRHAAIQCCISIDVLSSSSSAPTPSPWPSFAPPLALAPPPPVKEEEEEPKPPAPLFPLSAHDVAFLAACGLEVDGRVRDAQAPALPAEWTVGAGSVLPAPLRRVRVRPESGLAFQWSKARGPP